MFKDDPILGKFFDSPEKIAKWHYRLTILYIIWIAFVIGGISFLIYWWIF